MVSIAVAAESMCRHPQAPKSPPQDIMKSPVIIEFCKAVAAEAARVDRFFQPRYEALKAYVTALTECAASGDFAAANEIVLCCLNDECSSPSACDKTFASDANNIVSSNLNLLFTRIESNIASHKDRDNCEEGVTGDLRVLLDKLAAGSRGLQALHTFCMLNASGFRRIVKRFCTANKLTVGFSLVEALIAELPWYHPAELANQLVEAHCLKLMLASQHKCEPIRSTGLITCQICEKTLSDPTVLACTHRFCIDCIINHFGKDERHECPTCHAHTSGQYEVHVRLSELVERVLSAEKQGIVSSVPQLLSLSSITDLAGHIDGQTCFIFDVDETLMTPRNFPAIILSEAGRKYFQVYAHHNIPDVFNRLHLTTELANCMHDVVTCENNTAEMIRRIQKSGCPVFGLTARMTEQQHTTQMALKGLGIDFSESSPFKTPVVCEGPERPSMCNGIVFCNGYNKGETLEYYLETYLSKQKLQSLTPERPLNIVFVDDVRHNVESVIVGMSESRLFRQGLVRLNAYHYVPPMLAELFANYQQVNERRREILELQIETFASERRILSDVQAFRLLPGSAVKNKT